MNLGLTSNGEEERWLLGTEGEVNRRRREKGEVEVGEGL